MQANATKNKFHAECQARMKTSIVIQLTLFHPYRLYLQSPVVAENIKADLFMKISLKMNFLFGLYTNQFNHKLSVRAIFLADSFLHKAWLLPYLATKQLDF